MGGSASLLPMSSSAIRALDINAVLAGGEVLPGFSVAVRALFEK